MKSLPRVATTLLITCALTLAAASGAAPAGDHPRRYVCPPCGMPCDQVIHDAPGVCPVCGATLIAQEAAQEMAASVHGKVAILIFDGVEIIDFTGPFEVFGAANFDVYTVAETKQPVTTAMGMTVVPKYTFADAPDPDVLLVPGGGVAGPRGSAATLKWIAGQAARTEHTMSVCNGAFILASAGLLDGLSATTTDHLIGKLRAEFPRIKVVDDQRFVDNGRIITTAGLSAGIDGALHVVARMLGQGAAQAVALGIEYDWRPRSGFARAALADKLIPDLDLETLGTWDMVSTEGGTDRWEMVARATSTLSATELIDRIGEALAKQGKWTNVKSAARRSSRPASDWRFSGRDGKAWTGRLTVEAMPGESGRYTAKLTIARVGAPPPAVVGHLQLQ